MRACGCRADGDRKKKEVSGHRFSFLTTASKTHSPLRELVHPLLRARATRLEHIHQPLLVRGQANHLAHQVPDHLRPLRNRALLVRRPHRAGPLLHRVTLVQTNGNARAAHSQRRIGKMCTDERGHDYVAATNFWGEKSKGTRGEKNTLQIR